MPASALTRPAWVASEGCSAFKINRVQAGRPVFICICNDIGAKSVALPDDVRAVERLQTQLKDFIRRGVSDAITRAQTDFRTLTPQQMNGFVDAIYEAAFDILQTLAEAMAET